MDKIIASICIFTFCCSPIFSQITLPFTDSFSSTSPSATNYFDSNMDKNQGGTVACAAGNYCCNAIGTNSYLIVKEIIVPSNKDVTISFKAKKFGTYSGTPVVYFRIGEELTTFSSPGSTDGWIQLGTVTVFACGTNTFTIPHGLVGGQQISICIYFPGGSNTTNGVMIDDLSITATGSYTLPTLPWAENFSNAKWYNTYVSGNTLASNTPFVKSAYRSKYSSTSASTDILNTSNGGANATSVNYLGTLSDYYCQFNNKDDASFSKTYTPYSSFVTQEINTTGCSNNYVTLRFAFKNEYPIGASTNYSYTSSENYISYSPKVFYTTTDGYEGTWTQLNINYYFPMGVWWYASVTVPSASKIKFRFEEGSASSAYSQKIDDIKIFCEDCRISSQIGGTISGPGGWLPNTEYNFSIDPTPTPQATYYKWIVRNKTTTPATIYYGTTPTVNPTDPVIVSGQGTTTATINFGTAVANPASTFRVMCIPYDAYPGTDGSPNVDVCYASISVFSPPPLPVELLNFEASYINESILLSWSTATETNNDYFTIEKSINAEDWVSVGTVDGAGSSNELINYEFEDLEPMSGTSYYRLKQTDFDGKYEYFGPVTVNCNEGANGIIAYPNPAQENVLVVGSQDVAAVIYLCDLTGRVISAYSCSRLSEPFSINLQNILPGIYLIRVDSQNSSEYFRVVKE